MALVVKDRVKETTATTGTGTITLAGASAGFQSFAAIGNANTTYYAIVDATSGAWEVGLGTYTASGTTLSRTTVLESSNANALVNFGVGVKDVFCTYPADKSVLLDENNALFPANDLPAVISVNTSTNALRITQTGTGNALLVEDSANPDATPFVVDALGNVLSGKTTAQAIGSATPQVQLHSTTASSTWDSYANFNWSAGTQAAGVSLAKSRSGVIGTYGSVASGDAIGDINFFADDGTAFVTAARITAAVDGTPGTNDMPGRLIFSTTADGASSPTERMRIGSAGDVGIGTTAIGGNSRLRTLSNQSNLALTYNIIYGDGTHTLTADNAASFNAVGSLANLDQNGFNGTISLPSGGNLKGFNTRSYVTGASGTVTSAVGTYSDVRNTGAGTLTNAVGFQAIFANSGGGTLTNTYGVYIGASTAGTNNYGFYSNIASGTGRWNFYANGTANNYFAGQVQLAAGTVSAPALSAFGDTNTGMFFPAADTIAFAEGGVEAMRIDSAANVGIGTASPGERLDVAGSVRGTQLIASNGIVVNSATVSANYTIPVGSNAMSGGPIAVGSGITVTVSAGSVWTVV